MVLVGSNATVVAVMGVVDDGSDIVVVVMVGDDLGCMGTLFPNGTTTAFVGGGATSTMGWWFFFLFLLLLLLVPGGGGI